MLAPNSRHLPSMAVRFGLGYEERRYGSGVVAYVPADRAGHEPESLDEIAGRIASNGFLEISDPVNWGYDTKNIYHPSWPKSGMAHIFYSPERREYIKIPVIMRRSHIQFFAMNALNRALAESGVFSAVAGSAMIRNRSTGHTCMFFDEAAGTKAALHYQTISGPGGDPEKQSEFVEGLKTRTKQLVFCLPRSLRPLCNDNPAFHPSLSGNQGMDNAFLEAGMEDCPLEANITLIDQAHPTISQQIFNAVASRM